MANSMTQELYANYVDDYISIWGTRSGLTSLAKFLLFPEGNTSSIMLPDSGGKAWTKFWPNAVLELEILESADAVKIYATGQKAIISGKRDCLAGLGESIQALALHETSIAGSHMHFDPGSSELISADSWPLVVELI